MEIVNMNASLATKKVSREKTINTLSEFFKGRPDEIGMRVIIVRKQRREADSERSQNVSWGGSVM
jgi:hypothetical protein